jgi:hypothetical protein
MVYYLPASEHKMLKSSPRLSASASLALRQAKANLPTLRISYPARSILFCTSATDFIAEPAERSMSLFDLLIGTP